MKPASKTSKHPAVLRILGANSGTFAIFAVKDFPLCWPDTRLDLAEAFYIAYADLAIDRGVRSLVTVLCGHPTYRIWPTLDFAARAASQGIQVNVILLAPDAEAEAFAQGIVRYGGTSTTVTSRCGLTDAISAHRGSDYLYYVIDASAAAAAIIGEGKKGNLITKSFSDAFGAGFGISPTAYAPYVPQSLVTTRT